MLTISKHTMPKLWWLNPWSTAKALYKAVIAMQGCIQEREAALTRKEKAVVVLESYIKHILPKINKTNGPRKQKRRARRGN